MLNVTTVVSFWLLDLKGCVLARCLTYDRRIFIKKIIISHQMLFYQEVLLFYNLAL